jgi:hypothetical protein
VVIKQLLRVAIAVFAITSLPLAVRAADLPVMKISADQIAYYNNLGILTATAASIDMGGGTTMHGAAFVLDLRRGRFVLAGGVELRTRQATYAGAALADDLAEDRGYLLALDPQPHRVVFRSSALDTVDPGLTSPPDAFAWPDVEDTPASLLGRTATAQPTIYVRFSGCRTQIIGGLRVYFPLPICYTNFGADPNLAQNSLSGANIGAGYRFAGNANATSAAIINYDAAQHIYGAIQQNLSSEHAWGVASVNPLGGKNPVYSLIAAGDSGVMGLRTSAQFHEATAPAPGQLFGSAQYTDALVTAGINGGFLALYYQFGNQSAEATAQQLNLLPTKQTSLQFSFTSSDLSLVKDALIANVSAGTGYVHDPTVLATLAGTQWVDIASSYLAVNLRAPDITFGPWLVNLAIGGQREWQSLPHTVDEVGGSAGLTRRFGSRFSVTAAYTVANVGDNYGALQSAAYPVYATPADPGYAAFDGFATFHTLGLGFYFTPRPDVDFSAVLNHNTDFPNAVPGFFPSLPAPALGQNVPTFVLGEAPYQLALNLRFRLNPQLSLLMQDTYSFNFGGQTWTSLSFQVRP